MCISLFIICSFRHYGHDYQTTRLGVALLPCRRFYLILTGSCCFFLAALFGWVSLTVMVMITSSNLVATAIPVTTADCEPDVYAPKSCRPRAPRHILGQFGKFVCSFLGAGPAKRTGASNDHRWQRLSHLQNTLCHNPHRAVALIYLCTFLSLLGAHVFCRLCESCKP